MSRNKYQIPEAIPAAVEETRALVVRLRPDHASILDDGTVYLHFNGLKPIPVNALADFVRDAEPDANPSEQGALIDALAEAWHDNTVAVILRRAVVK